MLRQASLHFRRALHTCAGTPERAVTTLIGANAAIYCGWQLPNERFQKNVMVRHFLLTPANINSGRLHTTITSAFSHTDTTHLLSNMLALYFFGSRVASAIGPARLLGVYLFGGFAGGVAHLYNAPGRRRSIVTQPSSKKRYWDIVPFSARPALGASGSVNGLIAIYALLFPFETVYVNLLFPVPAIGLAAFGFARDVLNSNNAASSTGHAAHIGGAVAGVAAFAFLRGRGGPRSPLLPGF